MTYPRIITVIALAASLLGPASAAANTPQDDAMLAVASAYWGAEATCPASSIEVVDGPLETGGEGGRAIVGGCLDPAPHRIELSGTFTAWTRCFLIVHEYGHLLGMQHSDDPASPMHATYAGARVPGCDAFAVHHRHRHKHRRRHRRR